MRVAILCTDAYGGHGGIALYTRDLIRALAADEKTESVTVFPRLHRMGPDPIPAKVTVRHQAAGGKLAFAGEIVKAMFQEPFDLIVCAHIHLINAAHALSLRTNRRPILFIYGIDAWNPLRTWWRGGVREASVVASISEVTLQRFLSWSPFHGSTFVLPNAIHLDDFAPRERNLQLAARLGLSGSPVLLTVGRLASSERYKGFDEVLAVLPSVLKIHPKAQYIIAGDGGDRPRLQQKVASAGLSNHVVFTGRFAEEEKRDIYNLADIFVMPSRGEGFGFVLLEALACGLPVIGSSVDGGREALRNGALGTLVDPSRPEELLAAILLDVERGRAVPDGLEYFAYPEFEKRVHAMLDTVVPERG